MGWKNKYSNGSRRWILEMGAADCGMCIHYPCSARNQGDEGFLDSLSARPRLMFQSPAQ